MINLARAILDMAQDAVKLPADWKDKEAVAAYLTRLVPGVAEIIASVAAAVAGERMGLVGKPDVQLIEDQVAKEMEERGIDGVNPAVVEAIITLIMALVNLLRKR